MPKQDSFPHDTLFAEPISISTLLIPPLFATAVVASWANRGLAQMRDFHAFACLFVLTARLAPA